MTYKNNNHKCWVLGEVQGDSVYSSVWNYMEDSYTYIWFFTQYILCNLFYVKP